MLRKTFETLLILLALILNGLGQESMQGSLSVADTTVSAATQLNFQLLLSTIAVNGNDYLVVNLPPNNNVQFETGRAFCTIQQPLTVFKCQIVTIYQAILTFSTSQPVSQLSGSIGFFDNPYSTNVVTGFEFILYDSKGNERASLNNGILEGLQPTLLNVKLQSSSSVVGASTGVTLTATVSSTTLMKAQGILQVNFPLYYTGSGFQDQMIASANPICTGDEMTVTSCVFNSQTRQLNLAYSFNNQVDRATQSVKFQIQSFKNPINPVPKAGFVFTVLDSTGSIIATSPEAILSGISQPSAFKFVTYQFLDTNLINAYSRFMLNIGMNVALEKSCYISIQFPPEFTIDTSLYNLMGTSFITPAGATSSNIPWTSLNTSTRTIVVQGCQNYFGSYLIGTITFQTVKNPPYIKDTGPFIITVAKDSGFTQLIAQTTSGVFVPASAIQPGAITQARISSSNLEVSATNSLSFSFIPADNLASTSMIQFSIPTTLTFGASCSLSNKSGIFSNSAYCSFNSQTSTININQPFPNYTGGTPLMVTVSSLINPISVQDLGNFSIGTFIQANGNFYMVDTVSLSGILATISGLITGLTPVYSSSLVTWAQDGTYIFKVSCQHLIPQGGKLRIMLPPSMIMGDPGKLQMYCYRINRSPTPIKMNCQPQTTYFDIIIDTRAFDTRGLGMAEVMNFQVSGLKNPRITQQPNLFVIQSYDIIGYLIDQSKYDANLVVIMTLAGQMEIVSLTPQNTINGAINQYTLSVNPNTPILQGDQFQITFPPEITLPQTSFVSCTANQGYIMSLICVMINPNTLNIQLTTTQAIPDSLTLFFYLNNIQNSYSTRPSSSFTNMFWSDMQGNLISQYTQNVQVTTDTPGKITNYQLTQSTKDPNSQAFYTISFMTNNQLPPSTAILVTFPNQVTVSTDPSICYIYMTSMVLNVCSFDDMFTLRIKNGFNNMMQNYQGKVEIRFGAVNPAMNSNIQLTLQVIVYDSSAMNYQIDTILNGLNPSFMCNYPCATCQLSNPSYCLSCPTGTYDPTFLQTNAQNITTCVRSCGPGYTVSSNIKQKQCIACEPQCATCRPGGSPVDASICLTCSAQYPVFLQSMGICRAKNLGCPDFSFVSNTNRCSVCTPPCVACQNANTCTKCDQNSTNVRRYLDKQQCVSSCQPTATYLLSDQNGTYCSACQPPCRTCPTGLPNTCLSCVNATTPFLYINQCLAKCPGGTSQSLQTLACQNCTLGCDRCNPDNLTQCFTCSKGYSLLSTDDQCYKTCPDIYIKSWDGSACELRQYPLDRDFIPFPFMFALGILWGCTMICWHLSKKQTQLVQTFIAHTAIIIVAATVFQLLRASSDKRKVVGAVVLASFVILCNIIVSIIFVITFMIQVDDFKYNDFKRYHRTYFLSIMGLSCFGTMHFFRFQFSKMFNHACFHASASLPEKFYKPLHLYSLIYLGAVCLPLIIGNIYFLATTYQPVKDGFFVNQLQMTYFEQVFLSTALCILTVYERFFQNPRHILQKSAAEEDNVMQDLQQPGQKLGQVGIESDTPNNMIRTSRFQLSKDKSNRLNKLKGILLSVKKNKNLTLNANLDELLVNEAADDQHASTAPEEEVSNLNCSGDESLQNQSFPGINRPFKDNGHGKRWELLEWMQTVLLQKAEKERREREEREKYLRQENKQNKYDNQQENNVFFSPLTRRKLVDGQMKTIEEFQTVPKLKLGPGKIFEKKKQHQIVSNLGSSDDISSIGRSQTNTEIDQFGTMFEDTERSNRSVLGPETKIWQKRVQIMKTILLEGKVTKKKLKKNTNGGSQHKSERSSEQGGSNKNIKKVEDKVESEEDTIQLDDFEDLPYKDDKSSRSDGEISSIRTSDLDEPVLKERRDLQTFFREKVTVNERNFNVNEILGNFLLDSTGQIIKRIETINENNFRDLDGQLVNERGYLLNEKTGAIRSRYTFEDMFMPITNSIKELGEIPMPYRWERWNFNPQKILGNFEFDVKSRKPVFLKNRYGQLTDKNYCCVNQSGFLINEQEDIIDNEGHVKFSKSMLSVKGEIPSLLNYEGQSYKIQEIIGQVKKDDSSKEILVRVDKRNGRAIDENGRFVNANGFLIDEKGNIVNQNNQVIFKFWELVFQEPPKIFSFTKFSIDWIKGRLPKGSKIQLKDDDLYDLDARLINTKGYLIDRDENIVDHSGRIVLRKELLSEYNGSDSEIPYVFLSGKLVDPFIDDKLKQKSILQNFQLSNYDKKVQTLNKSGESLLTSQKTDTQLGKNANGKSENGSQQIRNISVFTGAEVDASVKRVGSQNKINQSKSEISLDSKSNKEPKEEERKNQNKIPIQSKKKVKEDSKSKQDELRRSRSLKQGQKTSLYQQYIENGNVDQEAFNQGLFTENVSGKQVITPILAGSQSVGRQMNQIIPNYAQVMGRNQSNRFVGSENRNNRQSNLLSPPQIQAHAFNDESDQSQEIMLVAPKHNVFFGDSVYSGHADHNHRNMASMQSFASRADLVYQNQNQLKRLESDVPLLDLERIQEGYLIDQQQIKVNSIYGSSIYKKKR